jgi:hypothetical protein
LKLFNPVVIKQCRNFTTVTLVKNFSGFNYLPRQKK